MPSIKKVGEAYSDGKLKPEFINTSMEDQLMRWQRKMARVAYEDLGKNGYKPPIALWHILNEGFVHSQIATSKPWAVYAIVDGVRRRKRFESLYAAIQYHRKIQKRYPSSGVVSLAKAYNLPARYRLSKDKLPKRFKWCPYCVTFRVYKRVEPAVRFSALIKHWSDTKQRFEWSDRMIWLTECQLCGHTNRDAVFRRANQPYELKRLKSTRKVRRKQ